MKRKEVLEGDYEFRSKREFKRAELDHELGHETNNIQVVINGKRWKVIPGRGRADSADERQNLQKMKAWAERKSAETGKKWDVYLTGASPSVKEMGPTTPGTTTGKIEKIDTAKKVAVVANPDGTKEEKPLTAFQPDPKDPTGKTLQTTSAPQDAMKPGTQVNIKPATTMEDADLTAMLKIAGLR